MKYTLLLWLVFSLLSCDLIDSLHSKKEIRRPMPPISSPGMPPHLPGQPGAVACQWDSSGFVLHLPYQCAGEDYLSGHIICPGRARTDAFCKKIYSENPSLCLSHNEVAKRAGCSMSGGSANPRANSNCRWIPGSPKSVNCNGQTYSKGSAICFGQFHQNVFCDGRLANNVLACIRDNSQQTMNCFYQHKNPEFFE